MILTMPDFKSEHRQKSNTTLSKISGENFGVRPPPSNMSESVLPIGSFTLFHLQHLSAEAIAAVVKALQDHIGPDSNNGPGRFGADAGDFTLTITMPSNRPQHEAMMALMSCLARNDAPKDVGRKGPEFGCGLEGNAEGMFRVGSSASLFSGKTFAGARRPSVVSSNARDEPVFSISNWSEEVSGRSSTSSVRVPEADHVAAATGTLTSEFWKSFAPINLHEAAAQNDTKALNVLLAAGKDPYATDANGRLPIEMSMSPYIWKAFAEWMPCSSNSLLEAAKRGDAVDVRLFLSQGLDVGMMGGEGLNAVHLAARDGHEEVLQVLLDYGGAELLELPTALETVLKDELEGEFTPLHVAAAFDRARIVRMLVKRGAFVEAYARSFDSVWDLRTPLDIAVDCGSMRALEALLELGAGKYAQTGWKERALFIAAAYRDEPVCRKVLETDRSLIKIKDVEGNSLLHAAMHFMRKSSQNLELVTLFVDMGADLWALNNSGETLLGIAKARDLSEIHDYLHEKGAI
ncbi:hypothetical protein HDU96_002981 [Phlyctochytrium bullatum]|nr:hypothetical protein HDU96_002981 [Phlyctochytrium bullatum]